MSNVCFAKARRRFDECVEYLLQIKCRTADNFEYVSGSSLLLKRFTQLFEEAGVLDSDDGLRGEVLYQLDLLLGEGTSLLPVNVDDTNQVAVLEHWHREQGTE